MVRKSTEQAEHARNLTTMLNRELWEYSMMNEGDLIDLDDTTQKKYVIAYKYSEDIFYAVPHNDYILGTVYFYSKETAAMAITNVIMPFIKEHPEITW